MADDAPSDSRGAAEQNGVRLRRRAPVIGDVEDPGITRVNMCPPAEPGCDQVWKFLAAFIPPFASPSCAGEVCISRVASYRVLYP